VLDCPEAPGRDEMPLVVDCTGTYVRPEGGCYISGLSPEKEDDHESSDFEVDYDFFTEKIWPNLAHRIPAFECVKVRSVATGKAHGPPPNSFSGRNACTGPERAAEFRSNPSIKFVGTHLYTRVIWREPL